MEIFGLIGEKLEHSFSKKYFNKKFSKLGLHDNKYENFEINSLENLKKILSKNNIKGLNVTIPFKKIIIPLLDKISDEAKEINAVNTIKIVNGQTIGFNTDITGFEKSIDKEIDNRKKAIILGDGGASNAIKYVLEKKKIECVIVSRKGKVNYNSLHDDIIKESDLIINTTPLGTFPKISLFPNINYKILNEKHLLYDLVYNPKLTVFLKKGLERGCKVKNGYEMLEIQAEESWKIWNN